MVVCRSESDVVVLEVDGPAENSLGEAAVVVSGAELEVVEQVDELEDEIDVGPVVAAVNELVVDAVEYSGIQGQFA